MSGRIPSKENRRGFRDIVYIGFMIFAVLIGVLTMTKYIRSEPDVPEPIDITE